MTEKDMPARRRGKLARRFRKAGVDALLVTNVHNVRYLSGFTGDDSALLVWDAGAVLVTDSRYSEQAEGETRKIEILTRKKGLLRTTAQRAVKARIGRLGVEADTLTLAQRDELARWTGKMEIVPLRRTVEDMRVIKDGSEIKLISEAAKIAETAFEAILPQLRPGMTEIAVARLLDRTMEEMGAQGPSFPTIVAAGARSSLPHAQPTDRKLRKGDAVLFDWGARYKLYCSDLTRVVFLDRIPPPFGRLYPVVLAAQKRGLRAVSPEKTARAVDSAARDYLRARRFGSHFGHGLGHGVGLEIHEAPALAPASEATLKPGMVVTIEPGVYLPGRGGVRIEDMVVVTRTGSRMLTHTRKSPMIVLA